MRVSASYNKLEKPSGNVRFPYGSPVCYPAIGGERCCIYYGARLIFSVICGIMITV